MLRGRRGVACRSAITFRPARRCGVIRDRPIWREQCDIVTTAEDLLLVERMKGLLLDGAPSSSAWSGAKAPTCFVARRASVNGLLLRLRTRELSIDCAHRGRTRAPGDRRVGRGFFRASRLHA